MNEKELLNRLAELPREMRPGRDPWPEISAAMDRAGPATGSTHSPPGWFFKAAAASVVKVTVPKPATSPKPIAATPALAINPIGISLKSVAGLLKCTRHKYCRF